jgi:hypothetical protein
MEPAPINEEGSPVPGSEPDGDFSADPIIIDVSPSEE